MEARNDLVEGQEGLAAQVLEDETPVSDKASDEGEQGEDQPSKETLAVQKRLKSQKRAHERELRDLHARIGDLESMVSRPQQEQQQPSNYQPNPQGDGSIESTIQKAVGYALQHKELEERKAHDAQQQAHVHRQYQEFQKHLDSMGDKYDDFHDVVFARDTPYTPSMRDYALTLPKTGKGSAGEVLYKLGDPNNRKELERIAKLHPLDQASEMMKLSHALISGGDSKSQSEHRPLGQIKSSPVSNSHAITDKTPVDSIRQRMKSGNWK